MNLQHLLTFASVGKYRSLTGAAKVLRTSQSSITKQLKLLEFSLGAALYRRQGRGIELTESGKDLFKLVTPISTQIETIKRSFTAARTATKIEYLGVGGGHASSTGLLPPLLVRFKNENPRVEIEFRTARRVELEELILKGEIEIAVVTSAPQSPELTFEPYRRERLSFFVPARHPLAKKRKLKPAALAASPLVIISRRNAAGIVEQFIRKLEAQGIEPKIALRCESAEAVKACVRQKGGVGVLLLDHVKPDLEAGHFVQLKIPGAAFDGHSYVMHHRERPLSLYAQRFFDLLRECRNKS